MPDEMLDDEAWEAALEDTTSMSAMDALRADRRARIAEAERLRLLLREWLDDTWIDGYGADRRDDLIDRTKEVLGHG
jgi:hypothetical protein